MAYQCIIDSIAHSQAKFASFSSFPFNCSVFPIPPSWFGGLEHGCSYFFYLMKVWFSSQKKKKKSIFNRLKKLGLKPFKYTITLISAYLSYDSNTHWKCVAQNNHFFFFFITNTRDQLVPNFREPNYFCVSV